MSRRVSIALLLGLLLCALAVREYPELTHLCDNPSNDYSTVVFQNDVPRYTAQQLPVVVGAAVELHVVGIIAPVIASKSFEVLNSFPDLLHLLCVQRT